MAPADLASAGPDVPAARRAIDGYAVLAAGSPGGGAPLVEIPRPSRDPGPHLAYALQWWLFALAGFGIWLAFYRRAVREESAGADLGATPSGPGRDTGATVSRPSHDAWTYRPGG